MWASQPQSQPINNPIKFKLNSGKRAWKLIQTRDKEQGKTIDEKRRQKQKENQKKEPIEEERGKAATSTVGHHQKI